MRSRDEDWERGWLENAIPDDDDIGQGIGGEGALNDELGGGSEVASICTYFAFFCMQASKTSQVYG